MRRVAFPVGQVIFLDGGSILGSAFTDASRVASLTLPALAAGVRTIFASYAGAAQFAPGVSPPLLDQIPAGSGDFAVRTSTSAVDLTWGSADILFTVVPIAGFQQPVQLSCADGVPEGYQCSFSPAALYSGNSYLQTALDKTWTATNKPAGLWRGVRNFIVLTNRNCWATPCSLDRVAAGVHEFGDIPKLRQLVYIPREASDDRSFDPGNGGKRRKRNRPQHADTGNASVA